MAYIIKGANAEMIRFALTEVMAGRRYLSPPLSDHAIELYAAQSKPVTGPIDRYEFLTMREREVLALLARGATYTEIADKLIISSRTAETIGPTSYAARPQDPRRSPLYAIQRGLIDPDQG